MRMLRTALWLTMAAALGCAGSRPAPMQLPPGARIGILNVLEQRMTHVEVGSLRVDSFTQTHAVDWDLPGTIHRTIETDLRARGSYSFIPLSADAPADWKQSRSDDILSAVNSWLPGSFKAYLEQAAAEKRLDLIISVSSYDSSRRQQNACFEIANNEVTTKGYGLYTRTRVLSGLSPLLPVGQNTAAPFANIVVAVFQTRPAALAAFGLAPCSPELPPDFPFKGDSRLLSPSAIRQIRPHIERLAAEAVKTALGNARLAP